MTPKRTRLHTNTYYLLIVIIVSLVVVSILTYTYIAEKNSVTSVSSADVFSYASPESQGVANNSVNTLTQAIQGFYDDELIVGAEIVIIKNRKIILHDTIGLQDRENNITMQKNSLFNIRSMTKPVTGAAIQLLIDTGHLDLDDKVADYLPGFANNASQNITIQHLLTHRSGLPLSIITSADEFETLQALANQAGIIGPEFEPGTKFWYSDTGTEVLGAIIETITNTSLDIFITENIFDPLGMNNSYYYHPPTQNSTPTEKILPLYFGGTGEWIKGWTSEEPLYPFAFGSQSIYCTLLDYARFLLMWLDEGIVNGTQFLSKDAINRTLTPASIMGSLGSDSPYITGFNNMTAYYGQMAILYSNDSFSDLANIEIIGHSGSDGTYAWVWPKQDLIVLYFTQSRLSASGVKLEPLIDEQLIHTELQESNNQARIKYADYLGDYTANFGPFHNAVFVMTIQNGYLAIDIPDQIIFELTEPEASGQWHTRKNYGFSISFTNDSNGTTTGLLLHQGNSTYELPKGNPTMEEIYPDDIEKYVGTYQTEEPNVFVNITINNGRLALNITGQSTLLDLYPPDDEGQWYLRINPSISITFEESEEGNITSFISKLPDGTILVRPRIDN